ncbi:hypothetical protein GDO81_017417 [Engystomops pustulosus]|uniref:Uncharacterized protein n=1 Tax=Engystomops pustulosus TaxID=76066 RepID=A0AAV7ANP8_ENGPU|nr:hypothetical protein GDO81_017417 [Engystomops pustulosus]
MMQKEPTLDHWTADSETTLFHASPCSVCNNCPNLDCSSSSVHHCCWAEHAKHINSKHISRTHITTSHPSPPYKNLEKHKHGTYIDHKYNSPIPQKMFRVLRRT